MRERLERLPGAPTLVRLGLAAFVLAWIFGPYWLRSAVPIWLPFLIALALEVNFFVSALRDEPQPLPDRGPQSSDRERYGYGEEGDELVLVRRGSEEVWVPYSGQTADELAELVKAAAEAPPHPETPPPPPARRMPVRSLRRFLAGVALIAGLAALFWVVESRTGWNGLSSDTRAEARIRFSEAASQVAGKPVTIRCDESGEFVGAVQHADGVAVVGGDIAYLTPERCLALYKLAFEGESETNRTGRAVAVLSHESWHLRGVRNEGVTECYALQSGVEVGQRLGLSEESARRMMRAQLVENELRGRSSAAYRLPSECRDGGRLDLAPADSDFP